ncbi:MAG: AzlC family ABC transporter permease [Acidimicrobiales bacterium]
MKISLWQAQANIGFGFDGVRVALSVVHAPPIHANRAAALDGFRAVLPLTVGVVPFGLIYGLTVTQASVDGWIGVFASLVMFSGAAQLTLVQLIDENAAWYVGVGTALVINSRMALYSAALAPAFRVQPAFWKYLQAALISDQTAAIGLAEFDRQKDPQLQRWYYLGAAIPFLGLWIAASAAGVVFGDVIPEALDLGFAVPLMFIALAVPAIKDKPALLAGGVAIAVTLAASSLPSGTNIILGAICGVAVGAWSQR